MNPSTRPIVAGRDGRNPTGPPQANIPQTKAERDQITAIVRGYVERYRPVPPMPIAELREHADRIVDAAGLDPAHRDYVGVIVSNEAWRDTLAWFEQHV